MKLIVRAALEPQDPPNQPGGGRPACAREEAYAEPDADLMEIDGGGHVTILPKVTTCIGRTARMIPQSTKSPSPVKPAGGLIHVSEAQYDRHRI